MSFSLWLSLFHRCHEVLVRDFSRHNMATNFEFVTKYRLHIRRGS